jgi:hypothetical protein
LLHHLRPPSCFGVPFIDRSRENRRCGGREDSLTKRFRAVGHCGENQPTKSRTDGIVENRRPRFLDKHKKAGVSRLHITCDHLPLSAPLGRRGRERWGNAAQTTDKDCTIPTSRGDEVIQLLTGFSGSPRPLMAARDDEKKTWMRGTRRGMTKKVVIARSEATKQSRTGSPRRLMAARDDDG